MLKKILNTLILLFFLAINTNYFWAAKVGGLAIPIFMVMCLFYLGMIFTLLIILVKMESHEFSVLHRNKTVLFLVFVLITAFIRPTGLIDFQKFEGKDVLIARREGTNAFNKLCLKQNNKFIERRINFGEKKYSGNYEVKNDTIYFNIIKHSRYSKDYYEFAVLDSIEVDKDKFKIALMCYKSVDDSLAYPMWISKNELLPIKLVDINSEGH